MKPSRFTACLICFERCAKMAVQFRDAGYHLSARRTAESARWWFQFWKQSTFNQFTPQ